MGRDKALIELAGKPLIRHAVKKLRRVCMDVRILTDNEEFAAFGPIVRDIHPGCGPMSGMEAGLRHSIFEWNLFMAVDMPFLPSAFLFDWVEMRLVNTRQGLGQGAHVRIPLVDKRPQPGLCMVHRDVAPYLTSALERGEYKLLPALEAAGQELARRKGFPGPSGFRCVTLIPSVEGKARVEDWQDMTETQLQAVPFWFANLNTPEEFAEAERHVDALDT